MELLSNRGPADHSSIRHAPAKAWYVANVAVYQLMCRMILPRVLPRMILEGMVIRLLKLLAWWEGYWVEFYLGNDLGSAENLWRIRRNPWCPDTVAAAYLYVKEHPEELARHTNH